MPLPYLCLLPHETGDLSPGEPLCAPAQFRGHVKDWLGGDDYLFRRVQLDSGYFEWFARCERRANAPLLKIRCQPDPTVQSLLHKIKIDDCERTIYFDADGRLASSFGSCFRELSLNSMGESLWSSENDEFRFRWDLNDEMRLSPRWRRETTNAQIETDVRQMLADSASHCAFAWNWLRLNQAERNRVMLQLEWGTMEHFENLLRAVTWSDPAWKAAQQTAPVWEWNFDLFGFNETLAVDGMSAAIYGWIDSEQTIREFSERHKRLLELIFTHLGATYNRKMDQFARALPANRREDCEFEIVVSQPTHHENLEAQLQLRDFLRDKVSITELRELMPQ